VVLAAAAAVQARFLNAAEVSRWAGARAASESLKADVFRYLSGVDPYADANRDTRLNARVDEFEAVAKPPRQLPADVVGQQAAAAGPRSADLRTAPRPTSGGLAPGEDQ
jgi:hypothetical protein